MTLLGPIREVRLQANLDPRRDWESPNQEQKPMGQNWKEDFLVVLMNGRRLTSVRVRHSWALHF